MHKLKKKLQEYLDCIIVVKSHNVFVNLAFFFTCGSFDLKSCLEIQYHSPFSKILINSFTQSTPLFLPFYNISSPDTLKCHNLASIFIITQWQVVFKSDQKQI